MFISLANSRARGFLKWSEAQRPGNDDDEPGGGTPIAIDEPPCDGYGAIEEPPPQPWQVPGAGSSF